MASPVEHRLEVEEKKKEKEQKEKEISSNLKHRKEVAKQMKKRTHKGQPLMKYQIPNLLEKIESRMKSNSPVCWRGRSEIMEMNKECDRNGGRINECTIWERWE